MLFVMVITIITIYFGGPDHVQWQHGHSPHLLLLFILNHPSLTSVSSIKVAMEGGRISN